MKQHAAAISFPAAALTIILVWTLSLFAIAVPAEVAAAVTALLAYAAVLLGLSRDQRSTPRG